MSKILLINYRYFVSGGPEKYMFNIKKVFEQRGHSVVPFSVTSDKNIETEYKKYFVKPIGGQNAVYFNEYKKTPQTVFKMLSRSFYSPEVKRALEYEIDMEKPDAIYILHHINKLSPSVIRAAKNSGKKVVVRLSDFFLMCPRFDFLREGNVCENCLQGSLVNAIHYNCVQNSKVASIIRVMSMQFHRIIKIYDLVDYFVAPSAFLRLKLIEFGFDEKKVIHIPTFIDTSKIDAKYAHDSYILYLGRLNKEKGVEYAIKAMKYIEDKSLILKVVGEASDGEMENIQNIITSNNLNNVELLGFKSGKDLDLLISNAKFLVVPSIWYDNMPNVLLEAFAHGKPAIASNFGSLPEVVDDGINGLLFEPKNALDLADKINLLNSNSELIIEYGKNAREKAEKYYNSDLHYKKLSEVLLG
ncbi:MAG: glycosyltransferase family 4 protein [Clostridiaceae bacterium]|nr:glycosyltransferase family 4 protein [Clostridiaceae bacterium]